METETPVAKPKRRWRKSLLTWSWRVSLALVVLVFAARMVWRFSGTNQWELWRNKNGIKVYTLKEPGADLIHVKGTVRVRSSLGNIVALLNDQDTCNDVGCEEAKVLERVDDQLEYSYFRYKLPKPFLPREFVMRQHYSQNPHTKELFLEYAAVPEKLPPNACCFRVTNMRNTWKFRPLGNGFVDAEYEVNMSEGGFIPDFMLNKMRAQFMYFVMKNMQKWLNNPKYQTAKYAWIIE